MIKTIKRIAALLTVVFIVSGICANAEVREFGAGQKQSLEYNVYIEGVAESDYPNVTFMLKNSNGKIGYISQIEVDKNNRYKTKFKFNGDIKNWSAYVKDGSGMVTRPSLAYAQSADFYSAQLSAYGNSSDKVYPNEGDLINVTLSIKNKYDDGKDISIILAAYNESGALLGAAEDSIKIGYFDTDAELKKCFEKFNVPEGTARFKVFAWENMINLIPAADDLKLKTGESTFDDQGRTSDKPWVIGFVGDSNTHHSNYLPFVEHYYDTRFPNKNIMFLNKGISGDTARGAMNRLDWDIFNSNGEELKLCDEIVVMFAPNDSGIELYSGSRDGDPYLHENNEEKQKRIAACVDNYEKIIQYCVKKNIKITVMSYFGYDESTKFETAYGPGVEDWFGLNWAEGEIGRRAIALARKYDLDYIDMYSVTEKYVKEIRAAHKDLGMLLTGGDRLHLSDEGGYLFGYLLVRSQTANDKIAEVNISAADKKAAAENADVVLNAASADGVEYSYSPKSLPIAVSSQYTKIKDKFGINLANTINREIIKVSGLSDGMYEVRFDDTIIGTYSSKQLGDGVNIAENSANPSQKQSKAAYDFTIKKTRGESGSDGGEKDLRYIAMAEQSIIERLGLDMSKVYSADEWLEFAKQANRLDYKDYSVNKPKEQELIQKFKERYAAEKSCLKLNNYTVKIIKK